MVKKLMRPVDGSISIDRPNVPDNKRIDSGKSLALDSTEKAARCPCLGDCAPHSQLFKGGDIYPDTGGIQGALTNLGHVIAPNTVKDILKRHGIEPAPKRKKSTSWKTFLKAHWGVIAATDFFTVEVWTLRGLVTHYVLFVMRLETRSVHIAGVTTAPNGTLYEASRSQPGRRERWFSIG